MVGVGKELSHLLRIFSLVKLKFPPQTLSEYVQYYVPSIRMVLSEQQLSTRCEWKLLAALNDVTDLQADILNDLASLGGGESIDFF